MEEEFLTKFINEDDDFEDINKDDEVDEDEDLDDDEDEDPKEEEE